MSDYYVGRKIGRLSYNNAVVVVVIRLLSRYEPRNPSLTWLSFAPVTDQWERRDESTRGSRKNSFLLPKTLPYPHSHPSRILTPSYNNIHTYYIDFTQRSLKLSKIFKKNTKSNRGWIRRLSTQVVSPPRPLFMPNVAAHVQASLTSATWREVVSGESAHCFTPPTTGAHIRRPARRGHFSHKFQNSRRMQPICTAYFGQNVWMRLSVYSCISLSPLLTIPSALKTRGKPRLWRYQYLNNTANL